MQIKFMSLACADGLGNCIATALQNGRWWFFSSQSLWALLCWALLVRAPNS